MNAGAYGRDWSDVVTRALIATADGADWMTLDQLALSYRHSAVGRAEVVAQVELRLEPRPREDIKATVSELIARRKATQPTNKRTFGSVFKNPPGELGAGRMLELCGLKGHRIGGARDLAQARELHRERGWRDERRLCRAHGGGATTCT